MYKVKVDGKVIEGSAFENMAQALAFTFQDGRCHSAKTLVIEDGIVPTKPAEKPAEPVKPEVAKTEPEKADEPKAE